MNRKISVVFYHPDGDLTPLEFQLPKDQELLADRLPRLRERGYSAHLHCEKQLNDDHLGFLERMLKNSDRPDIDLRLAFF